MATEKSTYLIVSSFIDFPVNRGSLRYSANAAFLALFHADTLEALNKPEHTAMIKTLRDFAAQQINYMLGDNTHSRSFIAGFGQQSPRLPYHKR